MIPPIDQLPVCPKCKAPQIPDEFTQGPHAMSKRICLGRQLGLEHKFCLRQTLPECQAYEEALEAQNGL